MKAAAGSDTRHVREPAERDGRGGGGSCSTHAHGRAGRLFPAPDARRCHLWGRRAGRLVRGGDVSIAGDITGPPSLRCPDWLRWRLARRASSSSLLVLLLTVPFFLAENALRWHLSPWRYCCCPALPAAQVAAWPEFFSEVVSTHDCGASGEDGCGQSGGSGPSPSERQVVSGRAAEATTPRAPHVHLAAELLEEMSRLCPVCSSEEDSQSLLCLGSQLQQGK